MKVLFHHIPKTAGSSLIQQIKQHITPTCHGARYDQELDKFKISSKEYKFYHGHYSFDKVNEFKTLNPDAFIFTFIRNPINRVISHYYNRIDEKKVMKELELVERRTNDPKIAEKRKLYQDEIFGMSLSDFLHSDLKPLKESYQNRHVRYFCRKEDFRTNRILALESAKDNLLKFYSGYGLTEYMAESLLNLQKGLRLPPKSLNCEIKVNTNMKASSKKYKINKEELCLIMENNIFDIEFYHFALKNFLKENDIQDFVFIDNDPLQTCLNNGPEISSK